jgi:hypothetical protein
MVASGALGWSLTTTSENRCEPVNCLTKLGLWRRTWRPALAQLSRGG